MDNVENKGQCRSGSRAPPLPLTRWGGVKIGREGLFINPSCCDDIHGDGHGMSKPEHTVFFV